MRILVALFCRLFLFPFALAHADLYQWTDANGVLHVVDEAGQVPSAYRGQVKVYQSTKSTATSDTLPLSPSRTYPEQSQGRFAQKLALDLGLIKSSNEDAFSPLTGVGLQPAGGWRVSDPLTPEIVYDVLASARRAADARRLALSADGAEAVVRQVAASILPPPDERVDEEPPRETQIIIQQLPPQVVEVEREPIEPPYPYPYAYVPVPVVPPRFHHRRRPRPDDGPLTPAPPTGPFTSHWDVSPTPSPSSPSGPFTTNPNPTPGPSHMPFGTSHMPFGTSHMPFGR